MSCHGVRTPWLLSWCKNAMTGRALSTSTFVTLTPDLFSSLYHSLRKTSCNHTGIIGPELHSLSAVIKSRVIYQLILFNISNRNWQLYFWGLTTWKVVSFDGTNISCNSPVSSKLWHPTSPLSVPGKKDIWLGNLATTAAATKTSLWNATLPYRIKSFAIIPCWSRCTK